MPDTLGWLKETHIGVLVFARPLFCFCNKKPNGIEGPRSIQHRLSVCKLSLLALPRGFEQEPGRYRRVPDMRPPGLDEIQRPDLVVNVFLQASPIVSQ